MDKDSFSFRIVVGEVMKSPQIVVKNNTRNATIYYTTHDGNILIEVVDNPEPQSLPESCYLGCHADHDSECTYEECPQLKDGEPEKSGRHCPFDLGEGDDW